MTALPTMEGINNNGYHDSTTNQGRNKQANQTHFNMYIHKDREASRNYKFILMYYVM